MRALTRWSVFLTAAAVSMACGGGGGGGNQDPDGQTNLTAQVDGDEFSALGNAARSAGGIYTITAIDAPNAISIQLYNIPGPGTYSLGINATGFGGTGLYTTTNAGWGTVLNGRSGSVTITTLTDTRIAGTFHFDADPLTGSSSGTVSVTDGEFDMLMQTAGAWTPPDPWDGSRLNGRIGTDTVIGATMAVIFQNNTLLFNANDLASVLTITIGDLTATGSFSFHDTAPIRRIQYTDPNGTFVYLTDSTSTGNVTVTTFNANRIAGTYTATLKRLGAAGTVDVSGNFDVGIPHF
ncbi:MAG TPA: DUF6252 family protein [Gemmatimonadales bacterium]|nr:DUF6252 family protein [Gemmatimonadales bacterium]